MIPNRTRYLHAGYLFLSISSFVVTWSNFLPLIKKDGFVGATLNFFELVRVNEASRFITVDALVLAILCSWWLLIEAKKLKMRSAWLYIAASLLLGISTFFPLFLIHRDRVATHFSQTNGATGLSVLDIALMSAITAGLIGFIVLRLSN